MTLRTDLSVVTLDWETYYSDEYQLKKLTTSQYVRDPRFQTIGVGVRTPDGTLTWYEDAEFREWIKTVDWSKTATLAHHAQFDNLILTHHYGVVPAFIYDTLSCARALHGTDVGGSLAELSLHYGVGEKGHEVLNAKNKRREDFTPEEWATYGAYCKNDVALTWALFQKMAPKFPADELELIDQTIRMFSEPQLVLDGKRLAKFLEFEQGRKRDLLRKLVLQDQAPRCEECDVSPVEGCMSCEAETEGYIRSQLQSSDKLAALFQALDVEPPTKPSPKTPDKRLFAFAKSDPGMQELLDHPRDEVRFLAEARIAVKSTINETRTGRLLSMADQGPLPIYLKYAGAHTHRDSGGDAINPQNFARGGEIRHSIMAPPGHKIVVADSAQIEARGNGYLAGHEVLLQAFRENRDVYSEFASEAYGRPVNRKKNPEDYIPGFVGKVCVLGLGYQMGPIKFAQTMLAGALGGPPVVFTRELMDQLGVSLGEFTANPRSVKRVREMQSRLSYEDRLVHCAVANEFVVRYRAANQPIVAFWDRLQGFLPSMVIPGASHRHPDLPWFVFKYHEIAFPSGLPLRYPGLREEYGDGWEYYGGKRKPHVNLYGGKICENVTQKFARNVVFSQALDIQRETGFRPALRTHDELVYVVPESVAEDMLATTLKIMRTAPAWAPGLPLNAEGGVADRYGEAK